MPAESTLTPSKGHLSHQDTPSPAPPISSAVYTWQLAAPYASLFCASGPSHVSIPWTVPPSSPLSPPSRGRCTVRPRGEACSPPCAGCSCYIGLLRGLRPFLSSKLAKLEPHGSPSLLPTPVWAADGCRGSRSKALTEQRLKRFPCWSLVLAFTRTSWRRHSEPREGRTSSAPAPCHLPLCLRFKSEHPPATQT